MSPDQAGAPAAVEGTYWSGVAVAFLGGVCAAFGLLKVSAAGPVLRGALGLDLAGVGLLMSTYTVATVALALPAGLWIRRTGARRAGIAGLVLLAAGSAAGALAPDARWLGLTRALEGLGFVLVTVAGPTLVAGYALPAHRALALSVWAIWLPVGGLLALGAAPGLLALGGWAGLWWAGAAGALASAVLLARTRAPRAAPAPASGPAAPARSGVWLGALFACFTFQLYAVVTFAPTVLVEAAGLPLAAATRVAALTLVGSATAGWLAGQAMHRALAPRHIVSGGFVALALALPLLPLAIGTGPAGAALLLAHGLAGGAVATAIYAWAPELVAADRLAPTMGLLMVGNGLGILVGPPVVGALIEAGWGWGEAAWVPAAVAVLGALGAAALASRQRRAATTRPA